MPRPRGASEVAPRSSARAPPRLKATTVGSDGLQRMVKPEDGRSPRTPLNEKKQNGTRAADIEAKLGQAQEELKKLKEQLAAAEAAKRDVQLELEEAKKSLSLPSDIADPQQEQEEAAAAAAEATHNISPPPAEETSPVTDVFEVVVPSAIDPLNGDNNAKGKEESKYSEMRSKLLGREEELERMKEAMSAARLVEEELAGKMGSMAEELGESNAQRKALEGDNAALEAEIRRTRAQMEQWRKAAEAATSALYDGGGMQSPLREEVEELSGRRKGGKGGMLGEIWKKKGHQPN